MKLTKINLRGEARWQVDDASGPNGKRTRKVFQTKDAAESFIKDRKGEKNTFGLHFATIPPNERAGIMYQLDRLKKLGWTLAAAVDLVERHGKQAVVPDVTLASVAKEFMDTKHSAGLRPRYVKTLQASINRFLTGRREKPIREITAAEIQEYSGSNGWLPATMRSYLVDVRTLFAFALKRKHITEDPSLAVDLPKVDEKPPGIVTPGQARASASRLRPAARARA